MVQKRANSSRNPGVHRPFLSPGHDNKRKRRTSLPTAPSAHLPKALSTALTSLPTTPTAEKPWAFSRLILPFQGFVGGVYPAHARRVD
ncbi:hypothetical protein QC763_0049920 [Podospora pseudopauciseta]|uniref:Uncharacterized protein n=1 Tax=Podospora pseudopauciseta TaxID=2093780 RepID=A0ABR0HF86_9PEZI|nr:hypothetical protein QC763_0049920 [Podospora pseudopauciseta]